MLRSITVVAIMLATPAHAVAQFYHDSDLGYSEAKRVSLGLTVPFGHGGKSQERKPRLELGFDHRASRQSVVVGAEFSALDRQKTRIGLSLSKDPHLMFNGREVPKVDGRNNVSTAVWIGIGLAAAAAAGLGAVLLWQMAEASSE